MGENNPLSFKTIVGGLVIAILGGVTVAYITEQGKFNNEQNKSSNDLNFSNQSLANNSNSSITFICDSSKIDKRYSGDDYGKIRFVNESIHDSLDVNLIALSNNPETYAWSLIKTNKYDNAYDIQEGNYKWVVSYQSQDRFGGWLKVERGFLKTIRILRADIPPIQSFETTKTK